MLAEDTYTSDFDSRDTFAPLHCLEDVQLRFEDTEDIEIEPSSFEDDSSLKFEIQLSSPETSCSPSANEKRFVNVTGIKKYQETPEGESSPAFKLQKVQS